MAYDSWMETKIVRGGVAFTEVDTNPQWGGYADAGTRTFAQVLAGDVPANFDRQDLAALQTHIRRVREALQKLLAAVKSIGDANDAIDHGAQASADAIYASAPTRAREAWALAPYDLPRLVPSMPAGHFDTSRWSQYADAIEAVLRTFP